MMLYGGFLTKYGAIHVSITMCKSADMYVEICTDQIRAIKPKHSVDKIKSGRQSPRQPGLPVSAATW